MNYTTKITTFRQEFKALGDHLESNGIDLNWEGNEPVLDTIPYIGSGFYNGVEGIYLKKSNYDYLSEEWERAVIASFPFTTNGCTFNLESISDFDTDGDRDYKPSISVIMEKNGINPLD